MHSAGQRAMFEKTRSLEDLDNWLSDPYAFDQVSWAVETIMEGFRPPGDPGFQRPRVPHGTARIPEAIGQHIAIGQLYALANPDLPGASDTAAALDARAFAVESRQKFGPEVTITVPPMARRAEGQKRAQRKS